MPGITAMPQNQKQIYMLDKEKRFTGNVMTMKQRLSQRPELRRVSDVNDTKEIKAPKRDGLLGSRAYRYGTTTLVKVLRCAGRQAGNLSLCRF